MMPVLLPIIGATVVVSLFSLSGVYMLSLSERYLHRVLLIIIGLSAGSMFGAVYFDLLPEAIKVVKKDVVFVYVALGFVLFFFLERFIYWYHGHREVIEHLPAKLGRAGTREFAYLNLAGDAIHNFMDGFVIAASFLVNPTVGTAATVAVILRELPQEMGDYLILLYAGFSRRGALALNFAAALLTILGGVTALSLIVHVEALSGIMIAVAAGGFTYIGASELIPELHVEKSMGRSVVHFIAFLLGLVLIWPLGIIFPK